MIKSLQIKMGRSKEGMMGGQLRRLIALIMVMYPVLIIGQMMADTNTKWPLNSFVGLGSAVTVPLARLSGWECTASLNFGYGPACEIIISTIFVVPLTAFAVAYLITDGMDKRKKKVVAKEADESRNSTSSNTLLLR
jgi:hypothetical protein